MWRIMPSVDGPNAQKLPSPLVPSSHCMGEGERVKATHTYPSLMRLPCHLGRFNGYERTGDSQQFLAGDEVGAGLQHDHGAVEADH